MGAFFIKLKNAYFNKYNLFKCLLIIITMAYILQREALLFDPLIIALLTTILFLPLAYQIVGIITCTLCAFFINKMYGFEVAIIMTCFYVTEWIGDKLYSNKKILIISFANSLIISLLYIVKDFKSNEAPALILSCFLSVIFTYLLTNLYTGFMNEKCEWKEISILLSSLLIPLLGIKEIWVFIVAFSSTYINKNWGREVSITSDFMLFLWMVFNKNYSKNVIYAVFASVLIYLLLPKTKLKELILVIIFSAFSFAMNQRFYLDNFFLQFILGTVTSYLTPKIMFNLKEKKLDDSKENKLETINEFCTLLEDKRFEKYSDLEYQLLLDIDNTICSSCSKKNECSLLDKNVVSSYLDETRKNDIINRCLYPYPIMKKISAHNQRYYEFNNAQIEELKYKDNLIKSFSIIKKIIDDERKINSKVDRYRLEIESLSVGLSKDNGDYYDSFSFRNYSYVLLSDGMGHEKSSKDISSYVISLAKILLSTEDNVFKVVNDINDIMLTKTHEELYATLDVVSFDLSKGTCKLYKAGSFSTFLIRKKIVREYTPLLPPIGIVHNVKEKYEEIDLQEGDILLLITDGFGEDVGMMINSTTQKSVFLSLKNYIKFLYNRFNKEKICNDDKTIVGIKVRKV